MRCIQTKKANRVIGAPPRWKDHSDAPCDAIFVEMTELHSIPALKTNWVPDAAELAHLNAGGSIALYIVGQRAHPVIAIAAEPKE